MKLKKAAQKNIIKLLTRFNLPAKISLMSGADNMIETESNKEDGIYCKFCNANVPELDENGNVDADAFYPCNHLVYLFIGSGGGFETVSEEMKQFIEEQGEDFKLVDFVRKPNRFADIVVEHEDSITGYYGFKSPDKAVSST
jgi:hypothetical protein